VSGQYICSRSGNTPFGEEALSDDRKGEMGEWRQVARCSDRSPIGHHRQEIAAEHLQQPFNDDRPNPTVTLGKRSRPEQQHRSDHLRGKGIADPGGVRAKQCSLHLARQ